MGRHTSPAHDTRADEILKDADSYFSRERQRIAQEVASEMERERNRRRHNGRTARV